MMALSRAVDRGQAFRPQTTAKLIAVAVHFQRLAVDELSAV
jgi:hypothetical protein